MEQRTGFKYEAKVRPNYMTRCSFIDKKEWTTSASPRGTQAREKGTQRQDWPTHSPGANVSLHGLLKMGPISCVKRLSVKLKDNRNILLAVQLINENKT